MKRLLWLGIGVAAGVALSRKAGQAARQATPAGIAGNVGDAISELAGALGTFGADIRAGMAERERELADTVVRRTGIDPRPRHALRAAEETLRASAAPTRNTSGTNSTSRTSGARARRADG
ncbi:MAG TPA: hypothetical protein VH352_19435 [Pseudonocardiaceae bacterium]|jgi:hypothetical protein|nr:hypothetical protein [Pseudonocardiaceae bacterium]